jgi:hypothetical protein
MTKQEKEQNALDLKKYFDTHSRRKNTENICNGISNWNACDYIDYNQQEYSNNGCLCWKQDGKHSCCHCSEV